MKQTKYGRLLRWFCLRCPRFDLVALGTVALLIFTNIAHGQTVTVAGFAYGGEFASASQRFPLAASAIDKYRFEDQSGTHALSRKVVQLAQKVKTDRIAVNTTQLANLKSSDQALVAALARIFLDLRSADQPEGALLLVFEAK